ncbi:MAG: acyltransferase [Byssovorax sp.]
MSFFHASPAAHARYLATKRFPSLDGLRFLSITPVIWHHATPSPLPGLLGKGPVGVDLFFSLSGFLIATLLLREKSATGTISARGFYARRALRIFPLYYGTLALYTLRAALFVPPSPPRAHFFESLPFFATFTTNWLVDFSVPHPVMFAFAWSLAAEEQFYLLWPWVARAARGWLFPASIALLLLAADQAAEHGLLASVIDPDSLAQRMLASIATPIVLGVLLAQILHHPRSFSLASRLLGHRASAPLLLLLAIVMLAMDGAPIALLQLTLALLVGASAIRPDHGLAPLTALPAVRFIGEISYGMYMLHVSALTLVKQLFPPDHRPTIAIFLLGFALTTLLAWLSHRYFERPFLRLADRFRAAAPSHAA